MLIELTNRSSVSAFNDFVLTISTNMVNTVKLSAKISVVDLLDKMLVSTRDSIFANLQYLTLSVFIVEYKAETMPVMYSNDMLLCTDRQVLDTRMMEAMMFEYSVRISLL